MSSGRSLVGLTADDHRHMAAALELGDPAPGPRLSEDAIDALVEILERESLPTIGWWRRHGRLRPVVQQREVTADQVASVVEEFTP